MLSIVITHFHSPVMLKLCLKSINKAVCQLAPKTEIIVVESQANSETEALIQENFSEVRHISFLKNIGYAKAVNAGLKISQGEFILILNSDIIVFENTISEMIKFIQNNPDVGVVGPQLLTFTNAVQNSCFSFPTWEAFLARRTFLGRLAWGRKKLEQFLIAPPLKQAGAVDWLQGAAMLVRRSALLKVGLMDERFFMYLEDADWCRRFWQNRWRVVYLPAAQMAHYYYRMSQKWGGLLDLIFNKYTRMHLISAMKYFWKWRKIS